MDMRDFVNFALMIVTLSVVQRPDMGERVKADKERKEPRTLGPLDKIISVRSDGTAVQMCGGGKVTERWIQGWRLGKYRDRVGGIREAIRSRWQTRVAYPVEKTGDYIKHIF